MKIMKNKRVLKTVVIVSDCVNFKNKLKTLQFITKIIFFFQHHMTNSDRKLTQFPRFRLTENICYLLMNNDDDKEENNTA